MKQSTLIDTKCDPPRGGDVLRSIDPPKAGSPVQFVTPEGELTEQGKEFGLDLELARKLFRDMYLARCLDNAALALQ
ncbi:MAG: pyruvate dehydrogenase (acetyl-transferring) E1 component subunit alpha, partial [Isosphaeraceae bacterium]